MDTNTLFLSGIFAFFCVVLILGTIYSYHCDKKRYNSGICPYCNNKLHMFTTDSMGNRGYACDNEHCYYTVWIGFKSVDRNHYKLMKDK